jgi:hypothetical protein
MCAVRALTEGVPNMIWNPQNDGDTVFGVVLRQGTLSTEYGPVPFVDLWRGGHDRVRILAYGSQLRHVLDGAAAQIGDRLQVWYDGERSIIRGAVRGRAYKMFRANVQRGH